MTARSSPTRDPQKKLSDDRSQGEATPARTGSKEKELDNSIGAQEEQAAAQRPEEGKERERFARPARPGTLGSKWKFHDLLHRADWGEEDPYEVMCEETVVPGTVDNEYGLLMEIDTPRELHGLTRSWVPSNQQATGNATESSKFAFGTAFYSLLQRLRQKFLSMTFEQFEDWIQGLRKIDGKLTEEIHRSRRATATHENDNKPAYVRSKRAGVKLSVSDQMRIFASHLQEVLDSLEVKASEVECLKVVETAASHGRIALVLENLFQGLWQQTDKNHVVSGDLELEAHSRDDANRKATYINVASLKMREGHADNVSALYLSDDGKTLVSADRSGMVMVWYLIDGEQVVLSGGAGRISQLTICTYKDGGMTKEALAATGLCPRFKITDGSDLLVGSSDNGSVCIWDLDRDCLRLKISHAHGDAITSVATCDAKEDDLLAGLTITAGEDGLIRVWDIRPMIEMQPEPLQFDVEWALDKMTEAAAFSGMSRADLIILLHSMELRQFEPMERIIWSYSEIQAEKQNRGRDFANEEFESLLSTQGEKANRMMEQDGSRGRETGADVLVFVLSGIALATANETVVQKFRPGNCLGGSGWLEGYFEADYNAVAKTEVKCLFLHQEMFSIITRQQYGRLLSLYIMDGLFASNWRDLDLAHRVGLASVLNADDQKALSEYSDSYGLQTNVGDSGGRRLFSSRMDHAASMPIQSSASFAEKDPLHVASHQHTVRSKDANVDPETPEPGAPSIIPLIHSESLPPIITPLTPFSSKKEPNVEKLEGQNFDADMGSSRKPANNLCTAAQIYGRKLRGGATWRMVAELRGHTSVVSGLALDGKGRLISASRDMTVRVWDLHDICARIQRVHDNPKRFSGDEADAVSLAVVEAHPANLNGHRSWVTGIAASGSVAVSVSYDSTIKVWSLRAGEIGHHLRTISCDPELQSLRLERISITDNGEFGMVCGAMGVFQIWSLIDGVRLPSIRWGGLADVPDADLGARMTNFDALSISGGAALVATCRDADILLWNSETKNGLGEFSRRQHAPGWDKATTHSVNVAAQAFSESTKSGHGLNKLVRKAVQGVVSAQSESEMDGTHGDGQEMGSEHSTTKASGTVGQESSGRGRAPESKSQSVEQNHGEPRDEDVATMPTGKMLMLPGCMKHKTSEMEQRIAEEHNALKLQMKSIIRYVKENIKRDASKIVAPQSATSPSRHSSRTPVQLKEKLRDSLWKLNKTADSGRKENWRERLCVLYDSGEFKYVSHKSKETEEDSGMFTRVCHVSDIASCEKIALTESQSFRHPYAFSLSYREDREVVRTVFCSQENWTVDKWVEALSIRRVSSPAPRKVEKTDVKASLRKKRTGWVSENQECLEDLPESFVRATLADNSHAATLLLLHSENLVYGRYTWVLQVQENCSIRAGVLSCQNASLPLSFDAGDAKDQDRWSWHLESNEEGASLGKTPFGEAEGKEPQPSLSFGRCGDELTISLDCKTGTLSFLVRRGEETYKSAFGANAALSRFRMAPEASQSSSSAAPRDAGDNAVQSPSHVSSAKPAATVTDINKGRRLFAFVELLGSLPSGGDQVIVSKVLHESSIPPGIRAYFKRLSDDLDNASIIRPVPETEISYKGGIIDVNARSSAPKVMEKCSTAVVIHWPRTALPGPTKMEIRICPPPGNSEACCAARYTTGIDKLNTGRLVGVVVDVRPHGIKFNVPISIKIPHAVLLDQGEIWQNQFECLMVDDFCPVMDVPDCLFMCFDGRFDSRHGILTVSSSGIFALKASNYCRDLIHAKVYCQPSAAFLDGQKRLPPKLRVQSVDSSMHEVNADNFPVLCIGEKKKLPMLVKLCNVFCQDPALFDVLKAPLYDIPHNARIVTMAIHQCGYLLGVNLSLSHPEALLVVKKGNKENPGSSEILEVEDFKYVGGPLCQKFELAAFPTGHSSDLLLKHRSFNVQQVGVSLKLRGYISRNRDGASQERARSSIQRQSQSQYLSLASFPIQIQSKSANALFKSAGCSLMTEELVSTLVMQQPRQGLPSSPNSDEIVDALHDHARHHCDLYVIRNPAGKAETRMLESRVLESLHRQGWTTLDLSVPLAEGDHVSDIEFYAVNKCKATLVFVQAEMLSPKLSPDLPLSKMWMASLQAHGMLDKRRAIFGGEYIVPLSLGTIPTADAGEFPADKRAWKGQIGERLFSFRHNLVSWEPGQPMAVIGDLLQSIIKSGAHGLQEDRAKFFQTPASETPRAPSVKYICERVFRIARDLALDADVDLQTSIKKYFESSSADPNEFWMTLENEFALEILDDDSNRVQAFSGAIRMVHVRACKAAGQVSRIRDERPSDAWLRME